MDQPQAFLDGQFIPADQAAVPVWDAGFVLGTTVTEQIRTFGGEPFRLAEHLDRLERSLEIVGVESPLSRSELERTARELVRRNHALVDPADDLGLSLFVTPGAFATLAEGRPARPLVGMYTYRLPFGQWADKYEQGQRLVTTDVRQVPADCWPPELKCRSRMHYYLADRRANQIEPGARALMLDQEGCVLETTTANVVVVRGSQGIVSPPQAEILPGISVAVIRELADRLHLPWCEQMLRPHDLTEADEVLLASTSICVLPVVRFNGRAIGDGRPGPTYRRLLASWSDLVGLDVAAQARRFARRD